MDKKFLIIEARFYDDILDALVEGAVEQLNSHNIEYDRLEVPGALEIPGAVAIAADSGLYSGFIALGCVIRGETSHYDTVSNESANGLMNLSIERRLAIGNGIITVENQEQAWARAKISEKDKGGGAALAAINMLNIKERFAK
ncbi:6,7-dimethyl-8-ribityllumazine synthase [Alphaproteobacteria bacterium]|jgi:6,7-dimethyl-8-ribityllumazine synthase|nr:6,7-dimethyl-8-ribityllumazine synthase [Alphaproteobacteria bacterium]MBT5798959.1 6,7-dimethyl-8-ribityllumazine synthase [Alphaproteobacteria bacterium]MDA9190302.1 6,7-dimethyl-8-ribityllumazine synthase [Alphaproteobacteria bacterium]MDC0394434.1 6,7-dimethyl-8-ribityllumazine synthase [Alphaproteobacteria bacterium]MDC0461507.1 6,7-dimethyl-8-ribityllumazine synthase [Alphaproteobacteria bacterium]